MVKTHLYNQENVKSPQKMEVYTGHGGGLKKQQNRLENTHMSEKIFYLSIR